MGDIPKPAGGARWGRSRSFKRIAFAVIRILVSMISVSGKDSDRYCFDCLDTVAHGERGVVIISTEGMGLPEGLEEDD
jgi:hypothetical protein